MRLKALELGKNKGEVELFSFTLTKQDFQSRANPSMLIFEVHLNAHTIEKGKESSMAADQNIIRVHFTLGSISAQAMETFFCLLEKQMEYLLQFI